MGIVFDFNAPDVYITKLHEGAASFRVIGAESKDSQAGNEMIVAEMEIVDEHGITEQIREYFVLKESSKWKTKVFLLSVGDFESSKRMITEQDFVNKSGKCMLKFSTTPTNNPDEKRMKISEYLPDPQYDELRTKGTNANIGAPVAVKTPENPTVEFDDKDIPF